MPGRIAAMSLARCAPRPLRRELELDALDAIHFPLSVMLPPVDATAGRDDASSTSSTRSTRSSSAAPSSPTASVVYGWTIRRSRIVITISEHARQTLIERYGLAPDARARDPPRRRPRRLHAK